MSSPADNPFTPSPPPAFAPVEVIAEERRKFDEDSATALAKSWLYAGVAGLLFLAIAIAVGIGVYLGSPFPHIIPRVGSAALIGGVFGVPACATLMFAAAAWQLRTQRDQEQFLLALSRQRRALTMAGVAVMVAAGIFFFLVMMNVHSALA